MLLERGRPVGFRHLTVASVGSMARPGRAGAATVLLPMQAVRGIGAQGEAEAVVFAAIAAMPLPAKAIE